MHIDITSFIKNTGKLPSLPSIYFELSDAAENPNASLNSIGDIVRKDQSLLSRLLKISNSPLYGFPSQIETIEDALRLIGMHEMRDLALATCVIGSFHNLPSSVVNATDFWRHSIATGIASSLIAEKQQDAAPERFFVGGLLHDIGRLVMYLKAANESVEILRRYEAENLPPCAVETEILGFDHAALGAELLTAWKISPGIVEMVRWHHQPTAAVGVLGDDSIVHCADFITTALDFGSSGETSVSPISPEAIHQCLPDEASVESLALAIDERYDQLCPILTAKH